jgi:hypothetical protein
VRWQGDAQGALRAERVLDDEDGPRHAWNWERWPEACFRCARPHGNGSEPPLTWRPLLDADDLAIGLYTVWGIACPDCRVMIGDQAITLTVMPVSLRAVPDAG